MKNSFVKIVQNVKRARPTHGLEKPQAVAKHHNENIVTIVLRVNIDFYWLPKVPRYASDFMPFFPGLGLIEHD